MKPSKGIIRQRYIDMVKRYENTKDLAKKIQKKYKFIDWIINAKFSLTDAELEYLQQSICYVEDVNY
jgi:hypothetical protein